MGMAAPWGDDSRGAATGTPTGMAQLRSGEGGGSARRLSTATRGALFGALAGEPRPPGQSARGAVRILETGVVSGEQKKNIFL